VNRRDVISLLPHAALLAVGLGDDKPFEVTIQRISLDEWRVWRFEQGQLIVDACQTLGDAMATARRVLVEDLA
jgi:hypothetical protein